MTVDQEVNQVTVSYPETPGVYPIWIFNGATYSTLNNAGWYTPSGLRLNGQPTEKGVYIRNGKKVMK